MLTKCPKCHELMFKVTGDEVDFINVTEIITGECPLCGKIEIKKSEWNAIQDTPNKWISEE